jgi:hypothetical protein
MLAKSSIMQSKRGIKLTQSFCVKYSMLMIIILKFQLMRTFSWFLFDERILNDLNHPLEFSNYKN